MTENAIEDPIPIERWGQDHMTTLAYLETRVVDHRGKIADPQMSSDGERYPSRLKGKAVAKGHDDWDCLADAYAHGMITVEALPGDRPVNGRLLSRLSHTGSAFGLTDYGWEVAHALRRHIAEIRKAAAFEVPES